MNYTDSQVANIIEKYLDVKSAREFLLYAKDNSFSVRVSAADNLERAITELKKVTSIELRESLPEISLKVLEELCEQAKRI